MTAFISGAVRQNDKFGDDAKRLWCRSTYTARIKDELNTPCLKNVCHFYFHDDFSTDQFSYFFTAKFRKDTEEAGIKTITSP